MAKYYFLASLLPSLEIGHPPAIGWQELKSLLEINLDPKDKQKVRKLLRFIDIENLLRIWTGQPIDRHGNLSEEGLRQSLADRAWSEEEPFEGYLVDFLEKYPSDSQTALHFAELLSHFLLIESENEIGFLNKYFAFERNLRLVLLGFRAKRLSLDLIGELASEDPREPLVAHIIAQKDAPMFEPPFEFLDLKPILDAYSESTVDLHRAFVEYRFIRVGEFYESDQFSIDRILGYIVKLILVERWLDLSHEIGMQVVHTIEEKIHVT